MRKAEIIRIGLALSGGFARGIAHAGVLRVFERHGIPIHCIAGISAGAVAAAGYASGATVEEIAAAGCAMRIRDVARLCPGRAGLVRNDCMTRFLEGLLKARRFEEMRIPLGVVATDAVTGAAVPLAGTGGVIDAVRASCAYPGLFHPVPYGGRLLIDGAMSMAAPASLARRLGATHVVTVHLPAQAGAAHRAGVSRLAARWFPMLQRRGGEEWRQDSDLVITPDMRGFAWNGFGRGAELIEAGERAAEAWMPMVREWYQVERRAAA